MIRIPPGLFPRFTPLAGLCPAHCARCVGVRAASALGYVSVSRLGDLGGPEENLVPPILCPG